MTHLPHVNGNGAALRPGEIPVDVSVVVPIFNEAENLPALHARLVAALVGAGRNWEVLFVDDGSTDGSPRLLHHFHTADARVKAVHLSRNFGHQPAISAGIHLAAGRCVIVMDGDLQDPPELIGELLAKWDEGFEVVLAERRSRTEGGARGLGLALFYPLLRWCASLPDGPNAGVFGLMDRAVVEQFNRLPERNRFIPGLRSWLGFRRASVPYDRARRAGGASKQSLGRLARYASDAIVGFSYAPLRWVSYAGFGVLACAFAMLAWHVVSLSRHGAGVSNVLLCVLFLGAAQLISVGILGEYVGRIYEEVKRRPLYVVRELVGFDGGDLARTRGRDKQDRQTEACRTPFATADSVLRTDEKAPTHSPTDFPRGFTLTTFCSLNSRPVSSS